MLVHIAMLVYGLFWTNSHKNEWQVISLTLALQFWVMVVCNPWSRSTPSPSPNMNDLKTMVIYVCRTMNGHVIKLNVQSAFMHIMLLCVAYHRVIVFVRSFEVNSHCISLLLDFTTLHLLIIYQDWKHIIVTSWELSYGFYS